MEHQSSNNYSSVNGNLTHGNMFNTVTDASAHGGVMPFLPQPGPMTALLQSAEQGNLDAGEHSSQRSPQTFTELLREQHFSFLNGGRLVIDLNIESGGLAATSEVVASMDAGSNLSPANVGPGMGNDSSENGPRCSCGRKRKTPDSEGTSTNPDAHQGCQCEITPVQGSSSGTMNPNGASSSRGHARGVEISGGATSQVNPDIPNRDENRNRSVRSRRRGIPQRSIMHATASTSSIGGGEGSSVGQAFGSSTGALGRIPAQQYMNTPFQPDTNTQAAGSSSTGMVHQPYQRSGGVSIGIVNQGRRGNHRMQLRSSVNGRDPRLNGDQNIDQPTENVLPRVNLLDLYGSSGPQIGQYLHEMRLNRTPVHRVLELLGVRPIFFRRNQVLNAGEDSGEQLDRMRLDIDQMTYEELLSLEERIGSVNTGLSEETIVQCLNRGIYHTVKDKSPVESCCICLDEFDNGQELGKLDCGHNFHFDCIKQWLMRKNFCPICKKTALIREQS